MNLKRTLFFVCLIILSIAAGLFSIKQKERISSGTLTVLESSDTERRSIELSYLRSVMDESLFPYAHIEIAGIENIASIVESNESHLSLSLFPGQEKKNDGIRSEVLVDYPFQIGDTIRYSWQFRMPKDFVADPDNRWWVFADWHVQPDLTRVETWDNVPPVSQPVIVGYGNVEGRDVLSLSIGRADMDTGIVPVGTIPFSRGEWHTVTAEIRWSEQADGQVRLSLDNSPAMTLLGHGATMLNGYQHYMKVGMYRHPAIATQNTLELRHIQIEKVTNK